jgi:hypothetical protein
LLESAETPERTVGRLDRIAEYAVGIGPHSARVDHALVEAAHQHCLAVHPYTANEPAEQARLVAAGVDGMFTDYPDRLLANRPADEPRGLAAGAAAAAARARCLAARRETPHAEPRGAG